MFGLGAEKKQTLSSSLRSDLKLECRLQNGNFVQLSDGQEETCEALII